MRKRLLSYYSLQLVLFCSLLIFGSNQLIAQGRDGDPSLCGRKWQSEGQTSDPSGVKRSDRHVSECAIVQSGTLNSSDPKLATFLAEVKKDLWDTDRLPKNTLYLYTLKVVNDWDKDADYNLSDWQVIHSPYTKMQKSFVLKLPACSVATFQFLSPWAPEARLSPVNIGFSDEDGQGWNIQGAGQATILTPVWFQYHLEQFNIERLSPSEAKTKACSSP